MRGTRVVFLAPLGYIYFCSSAATSAYLRFLSNRNCLLPLTTSIKGFFRRKDSVALTLDELVRRL